MRGEKRSFLGKSPCKLDFTIKVVELDLLKIHPCFCASLEELLCPSQGGHYEADSAVLLRSLPRVFSELFLTLIVASETRSQPRSNNYTNPNAKVKQEK